MYTPLYTLYRPQRHQVGPVPQMFFCFFNSEGNKTVVCHKLRLRLQHSLINNKLGVAQLIPSPIPMGNLILSLGVCTFSSSPITYANDR